MDYCKKEYERKIVLVKKFLRIQNKFCMFKLKEVNSIVLVIKQYN